MSIDPNKDGVDHINIYSKGRTELGRLLTNFALLPIKTEDGLFASMEGWWYWQLGKDLEREQLRTLWGAAAKYAGRDLKIPDWPDPLFLEGFKVKYAQAFRAKLEQHPRLAEMLKNSHLPLQHYYTFGHPPKVINVDDGLWITQLMEAERIRLQGFA